MRKMVFAAPLLLLAGVLLSPLVVKAQSHILAITHQIVAGYHKAHPAHPADPVVVKEEPVVSPEPKAEPFVDVVKVVKEAIQSVRNALPGQPKYYDAVLQSAIDERSAQQFTEHIAHKALVEHNTDIWVRITSPGGDAMAFLLMIQSIEDIKKQTGMKLTCVADVMAASAAFYFLEEVCDSRIMTTRTVLLAHGIQGGMSGNLTTLEDQMALVRALEEMVAPRSAAHMHMTKAEFLAWIYGRNRWLGPDEALKLHAVDKVSDSNDLPAASPTSDLPEGARDPNLSH